MQFKQCKYYEKSIERENCPFACICATDCYFTLKRKNDDLVEEIKALNELLHDVDARLAEYESEEECE